MRHEFDSAADVPAAVWPWVHFTPAEWACKGTGRVVIETDYMDRIEKLRRMYGAALYLSSGYRSPEHNRAVSSTGDTGPHTTARAADILIAGADALALLVLAQALGFTGFGLKQHGSQVGRFLHLDDLPNAPGQPRPWLWTY